MRIPLSFVFEKKMGSMREYPIHAGALPLMKNDGRRS